MRNKNWVAAAVVATITIIMVACGSGAGVTSTSSIAPVATSVIPTDTPTGVIPAGGPGHVFIIVLENESATATFAANSPAPYLANTLTAQGAYLPNYYGIGHASLDNYIAMVSGQAPQPQTQGDCMIYTDWQGDTKLDSNGQVTGLGCVYPTTVITVANQLQGAGFSWKGYMEDMGNDLARDGSATCAHPALNSQDGTQKATATDSYAARHNPFMYFHSQIDDAVGCKQRVVSLAQLDADLAQVSTTPNYNFITPSLCSDGHDAPCADGRVGGLPTIDKFLQTIVPKITNSAAFKQDGVLIITFDEGAIPQDTTSCCGEAAGPTSPMPGLVGPGGGRVGAVIISPFVTPGTVSTTPYNHYSLLRSTEDMFGLSHLGFAGAKGLQSFGNDVFTAKK